MSKDLSQKISDTGKNIHDAIDEKFNEAEADEQRARREVEGREMSLGEKLASGVDEAKHRAEAGIDHAKREGRDDPTA